MHYYTTLFDSFYLSRGIIMYNSLERCSSDFHLFIFAFDGITAEILERLDLKYATVIPLDEFETPELLEVKSGRTKAEYCWTCTPSVIDHVIRKFNLPECTYVDADLYFYNDPAVLITEPGDGKNVLITEHRYSFLPKLYEEKRSGRFCVQFVTFSDEPDSLAILETWRKQCIEWCYARHENGKFGDQKYLDVWPELYDNVHILQNQGGGIAPWNLNRYSFTKKEDQVIIKEKWTAGFFKPVFYHFQYVKNIDGGSYDVGWYLIPDIIKRSFYSPYLLEIENTEKTLQDLSENYRRNYSDLRSYFNGNILKGVLKKIFGYNIMKKNKDGLYN